MSQWKKMSSSSSVALCAAISPVGETMTEPPIMWKPSSRPHLPAAPTHIAFSWACACSSSRWWNIRRCEGSGQWMLCEGVL